MNSQFTSRFSRRRCPGGGGLKGGLAGIKQDVAGDFQDDFALGVGGGSHVAAGDRGRAGAATGGSARGGTGGEVERAAVHAGRGDWLSRGGLVSGGVGA